MKLLFVVHQYFPQCHSGTEQLCRAAAREATRRGDDVTVLSLDPWVWRDDPPLSVADHPYEGLPTPRLRHWEGLSANDVLLDYDNPTVARRFAALLDEVRPDAIQFFHLRRLGAGLIDVARDRGIRTVVLLTDFWFLCPRFTLLRADGRLCEGPPDAGLGCVSCEFPELGDTFAASTAARSFARAMSSTWHAAGPAARFSAVVRRKDELLARLARADAVIAPTRFLKGMFERNGFDGPRLHHIPYGIELGRVKRADVARPRSPLRVVFAGVLSPWKGLDVLVRAVLAVDGPLQLDVFGRTEEGMFQDYIDATRALARDDDRIRFRGAFGHDELDDVMAAADLLVVPSTWYENAPLVVMEAMEAGVPVAASDLGGLSEIVEPGHNGFRFPAGDVDALAALLRELIADPQRLRALDPQPLGSVTAAYDAYLPLWRGDRATSPRS